MVQKKKKGMWLEQETHFNQEKYNNVIKTGMVMAVYVIAVLCFGELTGFQEIYSRIPMLTTGILVLGSYDVLGKFCKQQWFYPGGLLCCFFVVLLFREQLLSGLGIFVNQLGTIRTQTTGIAVPDLALAGITVKQNAAMLSFSVLAGTLLALICSALRNVMSIFLPVMVLAAMLCLGKTGTFLYFPVLCMGVFLCFPWISKNHKDLHGANVTGTVLCVLLSLLLYFGASVVGVERFVTQCSETIHKKIHEEVYETENTTLPEGNLTEKIKTPKTALPALEVTMEQPEAMYLRGFTGAVFENDTWSPMNTNILAEQEDLLYWLNLNAFYGDTQFAAAADGMNLEEQVVTVQNVGACSAYFYVPFGLKEESYLTPENLSQAGVSADGKRQVSYSVIANENQKMVQVLERLQTSDEASVQDYRKAETAYREFVYENYLQIPLENVKPLIHQWEKIAENYENPKELSSQEAQECTLTFLSECFSEEGIPKSLTLPLEHFQGSSYQYATVAVLTSRYFGIPARYAEGYIITEEMVENVKAGEIIKIDSNHASAWVEVYQDGIGWIPMSLIPGLGELTSEQPVKGQSTTGTSNKTDLKEGEEPEEIPQEKDRIESPDQGVSTKLSKVVFNGLYIVIVLLLLVLLVLLLRRRRSEKERKLRYESECKRDGTAWIFADTMRLLETMGVIYENKSLQTLITPVAERFGREYGALYQKMTELNQEALFSSHEFDEEKRQAALDFRTQTIALLKTEVKPLKRVFLKWIRCFY